MGFLPRPCWCTVHIRSRWRSACSSAPCRRTARTPATGSCSARTLAPPVHARCWAVLRPSPIFPCPRRCSGGAAQELCVPPAHRVRPSSHVLALGVFMARAHLSLSRRRSAPAEGVVSPPRDGEPHDPRFVVGEQHDPQPDRRTTSHPLRMLEDFLIHILPSVNSAAPGPAGGGRCAPTPP